MRTANNCPRVLLETIHKYGRKKIPSRYVSKWEFVHKIQLALARAYYSNVIEVLGWGKKIIIFLCLFLCVSKGTLVHYSDVVALRLHRLNRI